MSSTDGQGVLFARPYTYVIKGSPAGVFEMGLHRLACSKYFSVDNCITTYTFCETEPRGGDDRGTIRELSIWTTTVLRKRMALIQGLGFHTPFSSSFDGRSGHLSGNLFRDTRGGCVMYLAGATAAVANRLFWDYHSKRIIEAAVMYSAAHSSYAVRHARISLIPKPSRPSSVVSQGADRVTGL